ncbi:MAG: mycofactocin-coupled SDR family oxidoreductase [Acidimicrobiia bacterium]
MTGRLAGKVALITGAGHGQGRSHALRLAQEGADIIAIDACAPISKHILYPMADDADLAETVRRVEEFDRRAVGAKADVRDIGQMQAAVAQGLAEFGHIDIVVANAGIFGFHNCWEIPDDAWDDMIDTNLKGPFNTIKAVVPSMIEAKRGGSIIITSSSAGLRGQMLFAHYSAAKFGLVGLMKTCSNELARYSIRVNTIHPGGVGEDHTFNNDRSNADSFISTRNPAFIDVFTEAQAKGDMLTLMVGMNTMRDPAVTDPNVVYAPLPTVEPVDISNAVLFLASDEARYITGIQLPVDAGGTNTP